MHYTGTKGGKLEKFSLFTCSIDSEQSMRIKMKYMLPCIGKHEDVVFQV